MQKLSFIILAFAFLWSSCKKADIPPSSFDDPVFVATFNADSLLGQSITAGLDDVYLFTRLQKGSDDVYTSYNTFANAQCPAGNCPGSLGFEFRSFFNTDSVFSGGFYAYRKNDTIVLPIYYVVNFTGADYDQYEEWNVFLDSTLLFGNSSTGASTTFVDNVPRSLVVSAMTSNGTRSETRRIMSPSDPNAYPAVAIDAASFQNVRLLKAEPSGTTISQFVWNSGQDSTAIFADSTTSLNSVTVTDGNGNTATASFEDLSNADLPVTTMGVTYTTTPVYDSLQLGTVVIQWVDTQGIIWRSDQGTQPAFSFFQIISSEPYQPNEQGVNTRKLEINYACLLFNEDGLGMNFSGSGVIALAYP